MTGLGGLATSPPAWLASPGEHNGIVLSSRVRLARNLADQAFRARLPGSDQRRLVDGLLARLAPALPWPIRAFRTDALSTAESAMLQERHLVSRELGADANGAVFLRDDGRASILINEEDHVRLQVLGPDLCIPALLAEATELDRRLEKVVDWAYHNYFGYLTSCPTNIGTGLRASVMLHLPGLVETKDLAKVLRGLGKLHMTARGAAGEGSEAHGHVYQVSNQRTLGQSEEAIADQLVEVAQQILEYEILARDALIAGDRPYVEDRVYRALGLLTNARRLSSAELHDSLSWIRFGRSAGIIDAPSWPTLDEIWVTAQRGHLLLSHPNADQAPERNRVRAATVRQRLLGH